MAGTSQYFEPEPDVPSRRRTVELVLPDGRMSLSSDRGVFAGAAIDPGTKLLLLEDATPPSGATDLLDLGCGYGPIALTLARRAPDAIVWAVDVNRRALELCADNANAHGFTNIRSVEPNDVPEGLRFQGIWSNPPIRIGKGALHALLTRWFERLDDAARATLVVQRNLGADSLMRWLTEHGWPTVRVASRTGYRLLEVRRG